LAFSVDKYRLTRWLVRLHGGSALIAKAGARDKKVWKIVETSLPTFLVLLNYFFLK